MGLRNPIEEMVPELTNQDRPTVKAGEPAAEESGAVEADFELIPASWIDRSIYKNPGDTWRQLVYAVSARVNRAEDTLTVRYIHPTNDYVQLQTVPAEEISGKYVPAETVDTNAQWVSRLCPSSFDRSTQSPTLRERVHLLNIHTLTDTAYSDPLEPQSDGNTPSTDIGV